MMKGFKDILEKDVVDVFLNDDEFCEIHKVNGREMPVLIDCNEQIEREKRLHVHADGIFVNQRLIYVNAKDLGKLPKQGSIFKLDGGIYRVMDAINEGGIYSITIEANTA